MSSGSYFDTLANSVGCDSVITLNLTIKQSTSGTETVSACDTFTWPVTGSTYTSTGSYTGMLTNAQGCDSVVTLNLTIKESTSGTETVSACDTFTWPVTGSTYTSTGSYTGMLTNAQGCDSVVTLNLTIKQSSSGTETVSACDTFTWPVTGITYTSTGSYTGIVTNAQGCDSVVTLNLTINSVDTSVTVNVLSLSSNSNSGSYQWLNCETGLIIPGQTAQTFSPSSDGFYAVIVTENSCTDTSACYSITGTSIKDSDGLTKLSVFPNPTSGKVNLVFESSSDNSEVIVLDMTGRVVFKREVIGAGEKRIEMDLEGLAEGVYFLSVTEPGLKSNIRLVVNR